MIITTGSLKFRKINSTKNSNIRPTPNKVRQAIFNILKHKFRMDIWIKQSNILDAFAGTGMVGFEALSRGIANLTIIEKDKKNFGAILQNLKTLNISNKVLALNEDFFNVNSLPYKYRLVYLDPPFYKNLINSSLEKVLDIDILEKNSVIVCETEKVFDFQPKEKRNIFFSRVYGAVKLTFLVYT